MKRNFLKGWGSRGGAEARREFEGETEFANEESTGSGAEFTFINEARIEGDWVQLAPYGDHRHEQGVQRFRQEDAQNIVNEFKSFLNLPNRVLGLPWYIGHPDVPSMAAKYPDQKAVGRIKNLEARADGLFANVKFSETGRKLIEEEAFHGHSVNWRCAMKDGFYRPVSLKSVGFTNSPNIPVKTITNEEEQPDHNKPMREFLITKYKLAATATDADIQAAIANAETAAATQLANEKTARETATTELANERKERAALLIAAGLREGKILPAEKGQWETDFANEFAGTASKLAAAPAKMKTQPGAALGERKQGMAGGGKRDAIEELVNERQAKFPDEGYHQSFLAVKRENPALFDKQETK